MRDARDPETSVYVRPHDIGVLFAAEADPVSDRVARVHHLFSAGPIARLSLRLDDGQFVDAEISRQQLEELGLGIGDPVAVRFQGASKFE